MFGISLVQGWCLDDLFHWCKVICDPLVVERATVQGAGKKEALCVPDVTNPTHLLTVTGFVSLFLGTSWC